MICMGIKLLIGVLLTLFLCSCKTSFKELFEYETNNYYCFNAAGKIVKYDAINNMSLIPKNTNIKVQVNSYGVYQIYFHENLLIEGQPGDYIFPIRETKNRFYLLSEKECNFYQILEYDKSGRLLNTYSKPDLAAHSVVASSQLHAVIYAKEKFIYDFLDKKFERLHNKIVKYYKSDNILWQPYSPDGIQWIIEVIFPHKPTTYLYVDVKTNRWKEISKTPTSFKEVKKIKEIIRYKVSDGEFVSGILSFPNKTFGRKNLPLIIFPHGGPPTHSMFGFDYRVAILNEAGFLVYQPNYRGSTGYGKIFRQAGWRSKGIKRGIDDIVETTEKIICDGLANPDKTFIFGGSWGGYCALASVMFYPKVFKGCVSLFGASDLVSMLHEELPKSGYIPGLDILQYGDIHDYDTVVELKKISPYHNISKIECPVLLFHFYGDNVISFSQSERFVKKMFEHHKKVYFVKGKGNHGFLSSFEEYNAYKMVIEFFKSIIEGKS